MNKVEPRFTEESREGYPRPVVLTSACLLGQPVRYDGGHKQCRYLKTLAAHMELKPICPELAIGLGVPRPPIHLVKRGEEIRLLQVHDHSLDLTEQMSAFAQAQAAALSSVDGLVAKQNSPSCGMASVRVHDESGRLLHAFGSGVFTGWVLTGRPELPVEEDGRLDDPVVRENFLKRVYVHYRWRQHCAGGLTLAGLDEFHTRHKYMVMAHSVSAYRRLGRLLAKAQSGPLEVLVQAYFAQLMAALKRSPRRSGHVYVLKHLAEGLRKALSPKDLLELARAIGDYRHGKVPLSIPFGLLRQHLSRIGEPYSAAQYYLEPYPAALETPCA